MKTFRVVILVLVLMALPVIGLVGFYTITGTPVFDEWECADGEAPYVYPEGGSACAKEGSDLPPGASWDPFGNRPFDCSDRWGWIEVEPIDEKDHPATDCVKKGNQIPDGWQRVD